MDVSRLRRTNGFSLVELLVACAILSIVLMGALLLTTTVIGSSLFVSGSVSAQQNARVALGRMIRDLRAGWRLTAAVGCDTGTNDVTFVFEDETGVETTVEYRLNGAGLERNQTVPVPGTAQPEVLIGGAQALTIVCYDAAGNATATLPTVRSVDVTLVAQTEDSVSAGSPALQKVTMQSRTRLRNN